MEKLTFPQPIPDPASGHLLQMSMDSFSIDADFEMTLKVRMTFWTNDNGQLGIPLADHISQDPNLSENQKARMIRQYQPFFRTASTRGAKIDPNTQLQVLPDENGQYPEGAIDEKVLWMSVLADQVPGDLVSDKVFALLIQSMGKMVERKRI
jgi:hypothetical protein